MFQLWSFLPAIIPPLSLLIDLSDDWSNLVAVKHGNIVLNYAFKHNHDQFSFVGHVGKTGSQNQILHVSTSLL